MQLTSPAFTEGGVIPRKYGQDHDNVNPALKIQEPPAGTQSFALWMDDPDVPPQAGVPVWVHWVIFNLPASLREIPEGGVIEGVRGQGTRGHLAYSGPRPPDREHRYFFKLFALDAVLPLSEGATKEQLLAAMEGHILETAELMGRYAP